MCRSKFAFRAWVLTFCLFFVAATVGEVYGQMSGGGMSGGGMSGGGMSGGGMSGGGMSGGMGGGMSGGGMGGSGGGMSGGSGGGGGYGGIMIQANGVLQRSLVDQGAVDRARMEAAFKGIATNMRAPSPCRKVSLTRLEKKIAQANGAVSDDMANLAGLLKIENVFVYPETGDVVIAGPAEGWVSAADGTNVGFKSGRPTLQLADLVVALRAYAPNSKPTPMVGCSIDPTENGLKNMQTFLRTARTPNIADDFQLAGYAKGIRESLGLQDVRFWGVSPKTNFAATMASADYRMKLIGIGLERPPVRMTTYIEKSNPASVARNSMVRWFFQPDYDCVVMTEDMLGLKILGDGVKLVGEDELVSSDGKRQTSNGQGNRATRLYAKSFTDKYSSIAKLVPVYASLRNLIDMTIVAAYLQKEGIYKKVDWSMDFFGNEEKYPVETGTPVKFAETTVNVLRHGRGSVASFPTGGGVHICPLDAFELEHLKYDKSGEIETRRTGSASGASDVWWWD